MKTLKNIALAIVLFVTSFVSESFAQSTTGQVLGAQDTAQRGNVIFWVLLVAAIVAAGFFFFVFRKRRQDSSK